MNLLPILAIQNPESDVRCSAEWDKKNGKYCGHISLYKRGEYHSTLISSDSAFGSSKKAISSMEDLVKEFKELTLKDILEDKKNYTKRFRCF